MTPSHVSEQLFCLFVADVAKSGLQYSTIKTYLGGSGETFRDSERGKGPLCRISTNVGQGHARHQACPRSAGTGLSTACDAGHVKSNAHR